MSHKKSLSLIPLLDEGEGTREQQQRSPGRTIAFQRTGTNTSSVANTPAPSRQASTSLAGAVTPSVTLPSVTLPSVTLPSVTLPSVTPSPCVVSCTVDNRAASVTCTQESVFINYASPAPWACVSGCLPDPWVSGPSSWRPMSENVPYAEILSARLFASRGPTSSWLSSVKAGETYEIELCTFMRSRSNRSLWAPRVIVVSSPERVLVERCLAEILRGTGGLAMRPKSLLVLINPYGGSKKAGAVYERDVKPVFEKAGIKTTVRTTRYSGDAKETVCRMFGGLVHGDGRGGGGGMNGNGSGNGNWNGAAVVDGGAEADGMDGVVAVGGDGLFHEVVAGLLEVDMQHRVRIAHVAAGSTDSVACTLNGTRSAFTAAVHVALGDSVALDVLRLDTTPIPRLTPLSTSPSPPASSSSTTKFAMSMASYGFFGNVMQESEKVRWLGPMRYDLVGARMWLRNRSYRARIEFLPAPPETSARQIVCTKDCPVCLQPSHERLNPARKSFKLHARDSRDRFGNEWQVVEGEWNGVMLVILPCRSDKSKSGVCKYSHLGDGRLHLVMIKACSRWDYLKFLVRLSKEGLESGGPADGVVRVEPCCAVKITHADGQNNVWNVDGELVDAGSVLHAEVHHRVVRAFGRGVEP